MSLPRPVYPGTTSMVTRRCTQRQYLLRPDRETNNAVIYCLAVAAQRCNIDVILFTQMSNHIHHALYDRLGNAPAFYEHFHKLLAKCMNALRGRWENFFASEQVCVVRMDTREELIRRLVYIATNPVKAGLVAQVNDWPGAQGYPALLNGKPLRATRPKHFFAEDGSMPEEVTLEMTLPPELGDKAEILAEVRMRVVDVERSQARRRAEKDQRVLGRDASCGNRGATPRRAASRGDSCDRPLPRAPFGPSSKPRSASTNLWRPTSKPDTTASPAKRPSFPPEPTGSAALSASPSPQPKICPPNLPKN